MISGLCGLVFPVEGFPTLLFKAASSELLGVTIASGLCGLPLPVDGLFAPPLLIPLSSLLFGRPLLLAIVLGAASLPSPLISGL